MRRLCGLLLHELRAALFHFSRVRSSLSDKGSSLRRWRATRKLIYQ